MKLFLMNELVKQDLKEIVEVLIPSGFTISLVKEWISLGWVYEYLLVSDVADSNTIEQVNTTIQDTGTSIIVLLTIGFLAFKFYRAIIHFKWSRNDRLEESEG